MTPKVILQNLQKFDGKALPRFDFHMHTDWTDGKDSVSRMHAEAISKGLTSILFSEHARQSTGGWFFEFARQVRSLPQEKCKAYVGVESKILDFKGSLDVNADILDTVDHVMAVVHRFPGEEGVIKGTTGSFSKEEVIDMEFSLAIAALDNPVVNILGHPFGMCYRRFKTVPPEEKVKQLIAKAASKKIAFEINSYYHPEPKRLLEWCLEVGAIVSLGSNAHNALAVGQILKVLEGGIS